MAFFEIGKPAPEKLHIEVKNSKDREKQYREILEAVTGSFYRLFETHELYKIVIDIRLEKVREEPKRGTIESIPANAKEDTNKNKATNSDDE